MNTNIHYRSPAIADHFSRHRRQWDEFYPSERWIIEKAVARSRGLRRVLDVGCAAGGLGAALSRRFPLTSYCGIDINPLAIEAARKADDYSVPTSFLLGDVVHGELPNDSFDTVFNLSCADWNVDTRGILAASWRSVAPGGTMVVSLRCSAVGDRGERGFQFIHYGEDESHPDAEKADYVVLPLDGALNMLGTLTPSPSALLAYGYWGRPSPGARISKNRILFVVFLLSRGDRPSSEPPCQELHLPWDAWKCLT